MIVVELKSLRAGNSTAVVPFTRHTTPQQQQQQTQQTSKQQQVLDENERIWMQRDSIIRREFSKCNYEIGDVVRPVRKEDFEQYGYAKCRGIVKSYLQWPKHIDFPEAPALPMITLCEPIDGAVTYNCTAHFVRKATEEEISEILKAAKNDK